MLSQAFMQKLSFDAISQKSAICIAKNPTAIFAFVVRTLPNRVFNQKLKKN